MRLALVGARVEQLLDQPQLAVAPDERRLEPVRLQLAARPGDDAQRAPELHGLRLPLQLVRAGVLEGDRRLRGAPRRVADEQRPRLGGSLDPRGGVHEVAGDHPLPLGAARDGGLSGEHARPRP
jgi:hypothetical protein